MCIRPLTLAGGLLLSGCASSSGVFATAEPETYKITASAWTSMGGAGTASSEAVKRATAHCAAMGKKMVAVDTKTDSQLTQGSTDLTFRCVL